MSPTPHVLLVTFPAQGHINPGLQFAKRLLSVGARVTFVTAASAYRRMTTPGDSSTREGLSLASIPDDWSLYAGGTGTRAYMDDLKRAGPLSLAQIVEESAQKGEPVTCLVYCTLLPWVARTARELHLPAVLLWNQSAAVLAIYYHYFRGGVDVEEEKISGKDLDNLSFKLNLPGLPPLRKRDVPSFLVHKEAYPFALEIMEAHIKALEDEGGGHESHTPRVKVLVNTFPALERDALTSVSGYEMVGVGPLIPSAFLDGKDPNDKSFGGDLFRGGEDDCLAWLDSKPENSVVYLSFGSVAVLPGRQLEEVARALLDIGLPFLWVVRQDSDDELGPYTRELESVGKVVSWCSQVEVLSHSSVGCFVTHCGWNSTGESLAAGVPVVGLPQWSDQFSNAKMVEEVWGTGVRAEAASGVVGSEELRRCLELVMGGRGEPAGREMRRRAAKWKGLAREAWMEGEFESGEGGGSSYRNLKAFVDGIKSLTTTTY